MSEKYESERREFVRLRCEVAVRYKFLSKAVEVGDEVLSGKTVDLSGGGFLLIGKIPDPAWYVGLLTQRIVVGVNMDLPSAAEPIKALCRVAWIEASESEPARVAMGLKFKEISRDGHDEIVKFVIRSQLK